MEFSNPRSRNNCSQRRQRRSKWSLLWIVLILCWGVAPHSLSQQDAEDVRAIKSVLEDQVAAWNRGDVEGYMKGYWNSDSTLFVSGGTLTQGYREVLSRYKKGYDSPEKMGVLSFRDLAIKQLSPTAALVVGVWNLQRKSDNPWGRFTLIFEKKPEGWRITLDHTSSAEH